MVFLPATATARTLPTSEKSPAVSQTDSSPPEEVISSLMGKIGSAGMSGLSRNGSEVLMELAGKE